MNLNEMKADAQSHLTRDAEFIYNGKETGLVLQLRHASAPEVQEAERKFNAKVQDAAFRQKKEARRRATQEWQDYGKPMSHVAGWTWKQGPDPEKGRPEFSRKELRETLATPLGYHLRNFILEEVGEYDDFLGESESN